MIRTVITQKVVIENPVGKVFQEEFNQEMVRLAAYNPQVMYPPNVPGHCAYITYTEKVEKPENAKDRLELQGIMPVCGECPFFQEPGDRRVKCGTCTKGIVPAPRYDLRACNFLCELMEAGAVDMERGQ